MTAWIKIGSDQWELGMGADQAGDLLSDAISREGVQELRVRQGGLDATLIVNGRAVTHATIWSDEPSK